MFLQVGMYTNHKLHPDYMKFYSLELGFCRSLVAFSRWDRLVKWTDGMNRKNGHGRRNLETAKMYQLCEGFETQSIR